MLKKFLDWLFCKIMGIKPKVKVEGTELYLEALERQYESQKYRK